MSRTWLYASSDEVDEPHLGERVSRAVIRTLDDSFSYFGEVSVFSFVVMDAQYCLCVFHVNILCVAF